MLGNLYKSLRYGTLGTGFILSIFLIVITIIFFKVNIAAMTFFCLSILLELCAIAFFISTKENRRILILPIVSASVTLIGSLINLNNVTQYCDLFDWIKETQNQSVIIALFLYMASIYVLVSTTIQNKECKASFVDYVMIVTPFALTVLGASHSLQ